jgi:two-component system, OmpR family, sensor histidine kinase CreC
MIEGAGKWRPSLAMITAGMIVLVLALALGGFAIVRMNVDLPAPAEIIIATIVAAAAASAVGVVFVRIVSRPLLELVRRAEAIASGDETAIGPLAHHGTQELASVTEGFMDMARSLSDRTAYVRGFARHVSHELKTPLTAIRGAAELISDSTAMPDEERKRLLAIVLAEVERMTALLERLSEQARADSPDLGGATSLNSVSEELRERFPGLQLSLRGETGAQLPLSAENAAIIFGHLLDNAQRHGAHAVAIEARREGEALSISVEDDGPGVSEGNRSRVFDPFFTTRRAEGGTGMGLAIVRAILEAHGGAIALVESRRGARFDLFVPDRVSARRPARWFGLVH